jgi:hypothetical protein
MANTYARLSRAPLSIQKQTLLYRMTFPPALRTQNTTQKQRHAGAVLQVLSELFYPWI